MKLADVHPTIQEGLAIHEALRRCGIAAADIFVLSNSLRIAVRRDEQMIMVAQLVGWPASWSPFRFEKEWVEAVKLWNGDAPEEDRRKIWEASRVLNAAVPFVTKLQMLGLLQRNVAVPDLRAVQTN